MEFIMFAKVSDQQQYTFICRNMCDVRMIHIAGLGGIKMVKAFQSIMYRTVLRHIALLLPISRGGSFAIVFHCPVCSAMNEQSQYQK